MPDEASATQVPNKGITGLLPTACINNYTKFGDLGFRGLGFWVEDLQVQLWKVPDFQALRS